MAKAWKVVIGSVMTIHKITAGDGYTYLTRQVAAGDTSPERGKSAAAYYAETGNPPGVWMGTGLGVLAVSGAVSEKQMTALFGQGLHPDAEAITAEYRREHVTARMTERQLAKVNEGARRGAALGRPFSTYTDLGPFDQRVEARLAAIRAETGREATGAEEKKVKWEEARRQRRAVAGFDLVFTPVSSVSRLWGLDPRPWVREAIERAHFAARDAALKLLQEHAAHTRTGSSGQAQIETHGLIAAVFDHADNRLGEPNLHSHVAVSSKVLGVDGKWRALDARGLYRMTVAASELYNTVLENALHASLGLEFETRSDTAGKREPVREITGFPARVLSHFTRRRSDIETEYQRLVAEFRAAHGRDPSLSAAHTLAQRATLATRRGKRPPRAWSAMREEWRAQIAEEFGPQALSAVTAVVSERRIRRSKAVTSEQVDVPAAAARVVAEVQEHHATWTRWSVLAQAQRELRGTRFTSPAEQDRAVALVVDAALSTWSLTTEPPELVAEPAALRRSDGSSVFTQHGAERYTSQAVLDAEARLVEAAGTATTVGVDGQSADAVLAEHEQRTGRQLDPGQRALAKAFACDGRLVLAGIGPAGAGKTTAMKALAEVIDAGGIGRLVALATSASAAGVLAVELGTGAENLHKFLWEWTRGKHAKDLAKGRNVPGLEFFALNPGDVILVDEAGMAGTLNLDRLVRIAASRGAVVRLLGDYRQLGAVESGGALRLIANASGAVELSTLYRFADPAEAEATLKIRVGDTAGLDFYQQAGRIRHGSHQSMTEQAYAGWKADMLAGRTALMVAATNAEVAGLCARARADRVAAGQVEPGGVRLHDGNVAGERDLIVTRDNDRRLRAGARDFVKNGDAWQVLARHENGALSVEHLEHHGRVLLPPHYVAANVELLYATTAHRAQGSTVERCHALITEEMARENFYVITSRARHGTVLYVATHELASLDQDEHVDAVRFDADAYAAREILEHVVARESAELSATEQIAAAYAEAESLRTLVPGYEYALDLATDNHYRHLVERVLPELAEQITTDSAWHAVLRALRDAEAGGWDVPALLKGTVRRRELATAESLAQVISWRLRRVIDNELPPKSGPEPAPAEALRYRAILARLAPTLAAQIAPAPEPAASIVLTGTDREREYVSALHKTLGTVRVNQARNDPAWPALLLALRRADDLGLDPPDVIAAAVDRRALRTAPSLSQAVALDVHRHLDARTASAMDDPHSNWPQIMRLLARFEQAGTDPAAALADAVAALETGLDHATLTAVARQLRTTARQLDDPFLPAWLRTARPVDEPQWQPYLDTRAELIRSRVDQLAQTAASTRPAWTSHLGEEPDDPAGREMWLRRLSTVAAYRDQYQVADDDPDHPLGPYPERGRVGHRAYWIAAASLLALRGARTQTDPSWGQLAADRYQTLERVEQTRIAAQLAGQLGSHWLGDPRDPAADADQPVYRNHLAAMLVEHGYLDEPDSGPSPGQASRSARAAAGATRRPERQGRTAQPHPQPEPGPRHAEPPRRQPTAPIQHPQPNPPHQPRGPRPGT
ncbi:relaxase domain-containing protein [Actinocrinis puniceicyclus]|uniref:Relaxase domain-containing protein n=1 Tax=Actinocrinis puniceicyclus TaxID=977794 RepID=A0A8J7WPL9_9ACTN|nr:MobF family relaxase [Actinocrinis puniceicyclus]MBS2966316.1 relaxase domain-containing protein [Actinocrinis puniceicyclus]